MWLKFLWYLSLLAPVLSAIHPPRVTTPLGIITGYYKKSQNSRLYAAYEGVPYALPPKNELRFKDPVRITTPLGHLEATKKRSDCAQYNDVPPDKDGQPVTEGSILGSDDCLYINIYVPVLKDKTKRMPVVFFIHGGSFQYASGNLFGDKYLADRDVVFVAVNYRLGILGFLSTEDKAAPGNFGLKDQSLALRWTSENIGYFGGDSGRVILVGFSAGSSSVQYHYLSPMSRGLFHGSIAMSGTAFNPWAFTERGMAEKARRLGALFNCSTEDSLDMIDCLREVPALTLVGATKKFQYWQYNPEAPWAPVVDSHSDEPFISLSPRETLEAELLHDVPAVYGMVQDEGLDPVAEYAPHDNLLGQLNDGWLDIAPHFLEVNYTLAPEVQREVAIEARNQYFGNESIDKDTVAQLTQLVTDQRYFVGFENGIRLQARASRSPVYVYYYAFRGSQSYSDHLSRTRNNYGVCHTDDTNLVVENPDIDPTKTREEWEMSSFLMDMWVSVAYNAGIPDVGLKWDPVDASDPELKYLKIYGPGNYSMSGDRDLGRKSFWSKFFYSV